jgi:formamidopyrimidine-DNA glycosylase
MPELPEVESARRRIAPAMARARFTAVDLRRPDLRAPFPKRFVERLVGHRVLALTRRGKYLLAPLSSGETLLMHLGMSGSLRVGSTARPMREEPHDHVRFSMSSGKRVVFNDPRRFGLMDLIPIGGVEHHTTLRRLGPEPLSDAFDATSLARACRGKKTSLKAALLDQRVVAGLGNIYAAEALHVARLSPSRQASTIATSSGAPRESAVRLAAAIKHVLERAIARQSREADRDQRFFVYEREGEPCLTRNCSGTIRRRAQSGRSTFFCPVCQN